VSHEALAGPEGGASTCYAAPQQFPVPVYDEFAFSGQGHFCALQHKFREIE
jgi:hypothetical protein